MLARKLMGAVGGGVESQLYVDDVFSTYVRTGTGADQTVTTNIDMTEGYLVWSKGRSGATDHAIYDSARGATYDLVTNSTAAQTTQSQGLKSVSVTGHTWGTLAKINTSSATYVDFVFRKAPKFFDGQTVTLSSGNATVSFTDLSTLGMVIVKRTDASGDWYVWHRSLTAGKLVYLNQTAAEATLGHITVSGTTLTLVDGTLADGSYVCYAFAHDTEEDGIIQCGSVTGAGALTVNLGWEPQYVMIKVASGDTGDWDVFDTMRGMSVDNTLTGGVGNDKELSTNTSAAESSVSAIEPTATGFRFIKFSSECTFVYLAIRRPNKPPTSGTEVYNAVARTSTSNGGEVIMPCGFTTDLHLLKTRSAWGASFLCDRLRGAKKYINTSTTDAEQTAGIYAFVDNFLQNGVDIAEPPTGNAYINHFFRRAPGFFDVVCYTGTGSATTVAHSLGAVPELMIIKSRSGTRNWMVYYGSNAAGLFLNLTNTPTVSTTYWNDTTPTSSVFTVGMDINLNTSAETYVAYLFATLAGISKVFSYTGNGTTQNIDCGFFTGARFVLCKRTDNTGDWFIFDSIRGIIAANDPHLSLNTTAAEVTTDDSIDPYTAGFTINQNTATNLNVNNATYIGLAIA